MNDADSAVDANGTPESSSPSPNPGDDISEAQKVVLQPRLDQRIIPTLSAIDQKVTEILMLLKKREGEQ